MPLSPANIAWHEGQPRSTEFGDIYHSADGRAEAQRVFIEPSAILTRAQQQPSVCVAELGFGTGLNFAVLATALQNVSHTRLHFISFEQYPLRQADWDQVAAQRAADLPIYAELAVNPPPLLAGWHQRILAQSKVVLQVYHGDVADGLADLAKRQANAVDAWFLDGFAPAKNPDMWADGLYADMATLSHTDSTVATFTAAGHVRRGLQRAGFEMFKVDQQPFKRESLAGRYSGKGTRRASSAPRAVTVHGAGMAGAFTARHLADSGVAVTVYDPQGIAQGASAMSATVLHSRLSGDGSVNAELRSSAFHYAAAYLHRFTGFSPSGVMWIQGPNLGADKLARISTAYDAANPDQHAWLQHLSAADASRLSAAHIDGDTLYYPSAGVVDAPKLCQALLTHDAIDVVPSTGPITPDQPNVVCASTDTRRFPGCELLEITDVYGQLDWYHSSEPVARMPIVGNGYFVPTAEGCVLGASYEHSPWPEEQATEHNLKTNLHLLGSTPLTWQARKRAARCVASDRTPVVGRMEVAEAAAPLWVLTGLGSMGTTAGVLAAAAISAEINGWLPPLSEAVAQLMHPRRFQERQARRGIRHIKPLSLDP